MKKIFTAAALLLFGLGAMAQQNGQPNDDQLQQQAPRETQVEVERAARREARRKEAERKQNAQEATKATPAKKEKPKEKATTAK